jgi:hypothetical protein
MSSIISKVTEDDEIEYITILFDPPNSFLLEDNNGYTKFDEAHSSNIKINSIEYGKIYLPIINESGNLLISTVNNGDIKEWIFSTWNRIEISAKKYIDLNDKKSFRENFNHKKNIIREPS